MQNKVLFIDATSGVSGDMLLGAFLDLGVPPEVLANVWSALGLDNYEVEIFETSRCGMRALRCRIHTQEEQGPRNWRAYRKQLNEAKIEDSIRKPALKLIQSLLEAEAAIHGSTLNRIHLHEMGGMDLLLDVTGTLAAVEWLKPYAIHASPVNTGKGFVNFSHGRYPVPTPAAAGLLEGIPVFQNEAEGERTTPTGALLIRHLAQEFGSLPLMKLRKTGVGAGERDDPHHPNVVRILLGDSTEESTEGDVYLLETNIDDCSPQILATFMEKAFQQGALDVFFTPVFMKKNRPAFRLSVLMDGAEIERMCGLIFSETTAIGLRYWKVGRQKLERKWKKIRVGKSTIRIKEGYLDGKLTNYQPEYEDCRKAAEKSGESVKEIMARAIHSYLQGESP